MVELAVVGAIMAMIMLAVYYGASLLSQSIRLNGASRAAAFAAAQSAGTQIALGTVTPNPTVIAQAVATSLARNLPGEVPTVTIASTTQSIDSGAGLFSLPFYTVALQELHNSFFSLAATTHVGSSSSAPLPPAQPTIAAPTTCWTDVPGFPQQTLPTDAPAASNELASKTGYYYVFQEVAGGNSNDIQAQWNTSFVGTAPYPNPNTLQVLIYKGVPPGFTSSPAEGTLTTAPPGGSAVHATGAGTVGSGGAVNTIITGTTGDGTANTYTVYYWNGSNMPVMTDPPGVETGEQGAQVVYHQATNSLCSS